MAAPVQPGDILAGKYKVDRVLGEGGMGVVVAATHVDLHQEVALKFMLPHALQDQNGVERFMREARAAVRLKSEHVARVMDVGKLDNGSPYIVMEYLRGEELAQLLATRGVLPPAEAISLLLQACVAMAEAHNAGIVHRDLKPENLFVAERPDGSPLVKVLDFGISKIMPGAANGGMSQTKTSVAMGSPAYMAPEQMRSAKHVDHRADIWSLGAILYQMLSAHLPFWGETVPEMFAAVLGTEAAPLASVAPGVPAGLCEVVHTCLRKEPEQRYKNVGELAIALAPFANEQGKGLVRSICRQTNTDISSAKLEARPAMDTLPFGGGRAASQVELAATMAPPRPLAATAKSPALAPITTREVSSGEVLGTVPPPGGSKPPLALIAGAAGIAVVFLIGGIALSGGGDDSAATAPAAAAQPPPAAVAPEPASAPPAPPPADPSPAVATPAAEGAAKAAIAETESADKDKDENEATAKGADDEDDDASARRRERRRRRAARKQAEAERKRAAQEAAKAAAAKKVDKPEQKPKKDDDPFGTMQ